MAAAVQMLVRPGSARRGPPTVTERTGYTSFKLPGAAGGGAASAGGDAGGAGGGPPSRPGSARPGSARPGSATRPGSAARPGGGALLPSSARVRMAR